MERYLESRKNLVKVIQLVDIRHQPSKQDVQMYEYLKSRRAARASWWLPNRIRFPGMKLRKLLRLSAERWE